MNSQDIKKLRIKADTVTRYYVQSKDDGWIYGGPFDTKQEAEDCLNQAKEIDKGYEITDQ
jgi:hypothetical protein